MHDLLDPSSLIKQFGYLGIFTAIFLESGVVIGFFLPGDTLLFAAGLLASQHYLTLPILIGIAVVAAILGDSVGYVTGRKAGPSIFNRSRSLIFSPKRVKAAHQFFEKHGPQSLILARFIPAVRCFTPIAAGIGKMNYRQFLVFNVIGGLLWGVLLPILGYTLGKSVPNIDTYLLPIILFITALSATPVIFHVVQARKQARNNG